MDTRPITPAILANSVIAVPPLARDASLRLNQAENLRIIRRLETRGVRTLLYGGNAVLGHVALSEYADLLTMLRESVREDTLVIPSVGPAFGLMMDQARILRDFDFPTAMLLPTNDPTTPTGIAAAVSRFVERFGRPAVLYLKRESALDAPTIRSMARDGLLACIKYAIVRENPAQDSFLHEILDAIGPGLVVSGMGEQPAVLHMRALGLVGFTSGCVCIAPMQSMRLLQVMQAGNFAEAERIREIFQPLEALRNALSPVRVLHAALPLAGLADTGPISPPLSPIEEAVHPQIEAAAKALAGHEALGVGRWMFL
jgi:dihydrodipicolinate synthase/N-acetylneuraminate lyase